MYHTHVGPVYVWLIILVCTQKYQFLICRLEKGNGSGFNRMELMIRDAHDCVDIPIIIIV
jgi:hypothetical protein